MRPIELPPRASARRRADGSCDRRRLLPDSRWPNTAVQVARRRRRGVSSASRPGRLQRAGRHVVERDVAPHRVRRSPTGSAQPGPVTATSVTARPGRPDEVARGPATRRAPRARLRPATSTVTLKAWAPRSCRRGQHFGYVTSSITAPATSGPAGPRTAGKKNEIASTSCSSPAPRLPTRCVATWSGSSTAPARASTAAIFESYDAGGRPRRRLGRAGTPCPGRDHRGQRLRRRRRPRRARRQGRPAVSADAARPSPVRRRRCRPTTAASPAPSSASSTAAARASTADRLQHREQHHHRRRLGRRPPASLGRHRRGRRDARRRLDRMTVAVADSDTPGVVVRPRRRHHAARRGRRAPSGHRHLHGPAHPGPGQTVRVSLTRRRRPRRAYRHERHASTRTAATGSRSRSAAPRRPDDARRRRYYVDFTDGELDDRVRRHGHRGRRRRPSTATTSRRSPRSPAAPTWSRARCSSSAGSTPTRPTTPRSTTTCRCCCPARPPATRSRRCCRRSASTRPSRSTGWSCTTRTARPTTRQPHLHPDHRAGHGARHRRGRSAASRAASPTPTSRRSSMLPRLRRRHLTVESTHTGTTADPRRDAANDTGRTHDRRRPHGGLRRRGRRHGPSA